MKAYGFTSAMDSQDMADRSRIMMDDMNNGDPNRMSKDEANYSDSGKGGHMCGNCTFYQTDTETLGRCIKVSGVISASGYSSEYTSLAGVPDVKHKAENEKRT